MTERRAKRTERTGGAGRALITERVLDLLLSLRALGAARTSDLMAVSAQPSRNSANKLFRRLLDAGLIAADVASLTDENAYCLTAKGWDAVVDRFPGARELPRPPRKEPTPHRLMIAAVWTRLARDVRANDTMVLAAWPEEALRPLGAPVVPDALFRLTDTVRGAVEVVALEADAGTEPAAFLRKKAESYAALPLSGGLFGYRGFRVAWVVPDAARAKSLARAVGEGRGEVEHLVAVLDDLAAGNVLDAAWTVAGREPTTATLGELVRGRRPFHE